MTPSELRSQALSYGAPETVLAYTAPNGATFFIKKPTVRERGIIFKAAGVKPGSSDLDVGQLQTHAVASLTVDAEGRRVFEDADVTALLECPAGGIVDSLAPKALELLNVSTETAGKN